MTRRRRGSRQVALPKGPVADPLQFDADVRWFRSRAPVPEPQWRVMEYRARRRAFWVAGATQLQVVTHVWHAIDEALARGLTFREFRSRVLDSLVSQWGGEIPGRLETIFRTNVQSAYSAGRWWALNDPAVLKVRPYWVYDAVLDSRTTEICRVRHGVALPHDHPWWRSNYPPLHFNCRSGVRAITERDALEREFKIPPEDPKPEGEFGLEPRGWEWMPDPSQYPPQLWSMLQRKIAEAGLRPTPAARAPDPEKTVTELAQRIAGLWADSYGARAVVSAVVPDESIAVLGANGLYDFKTGTIKLREKMFWSVYALTSRDAMARWMEDAIRSESAATRVLANILDMNMRRRYGPDWLQTAPERALRQAFAPKVRDWVKTFLHEAAHGTYTTGVQNWYTYDGGLAALEEAVTESWAQIVEGRAMAFLFRVTGVGGVNVWDDAVTKTPEWEWDVSYKPQIQWLVGLLRRAGVRTQAQFEKVLEELKFRVPIQGRAAHIAQMLDDYHGLQAPGLQAVWHEIMEAHQYPDFQWEDSLRRIDGWLRIWGTKRRRT